MLLQLLLLAILGILGVPAYSMPDEVQTRLKGGDPLAIASTFQCGIYFEIESELDQDPVTVDSNSFACSAVLIDGTRVLTSGYCLKSVYTNAARKVYVVCGAKKFNYLNPYAPDGPGVFRSPVIKVVYHPGMDASINPVESFKHTTQTFKNDIAAVTFDPTTLRNFPLLQPLPVQLNPLVVPEKLLPMFIEAWGGDTCSLVETKTERAEAYYKACVTVSWDEGPGLSGQVTLLPQQFCTIFMTETSEVVLTPADWGAPIFTEIMVGGKPVRTLVGLSSFAAIAYPFGDHCSQKCKAQVNVRLTDPIIFQFICKNTDAAFVYYE